MNNVDNIIKVMCKDMVQFSECQPIAIPQGRRNIMRAIKGVGNKSTEMKFCEALREENIFGWRLHENMPGRPDVYFPWYKIAVFLDGCFWHFCPNCGHLPKVNSQYWEQKLLNNRQRDKQNHDLLVSQGYKVIRFWEHELNHDLPACIGEVVDSIDLALDFIRMN